MPRWRAEALRTPQCRAAGFGMADALVHPVERELHAARVVLDGLVDGIEPALAEASHLERVTSDLQRAVSDDGARRRRAAHECSDGLEAGVDGLIERTERSWRADSGAAKA